MARYDRQYDFGLRGYRQTTRPMMDHQRYRSHPYDAGYRPAFDERAHPEERLANRVTARYNRDYLTGPPPERYDRNYSMYGGDQPDRMGDARFMRRPYFTQGGTRTLRGASIPMEYDYPDYRRYPDGI